MVCLIAFEADNYTLCTEPAEARGTFVGPAVEFCGQIVGLAIVVRYRINVCKANISLICAKISDGTVQLTPFTELSLDNAGFHKDESY
jgi:hypothetical protein